MDQQIQELINNNKIILFMKGDKTRPLCRFSASAIAILNMYDVEFETFNILENEELRQSLKSFSNWPTYPQLYINQKFVGGSDILIEYHENGEFQDLLS